MRTWRKCCIFCLDVEVILLGNDQKFYCTVGSIQIGESRTKKIFSDSMAIIVLLYCPSFINLFFPVLHCIGQTPDIARKTQG